jgi:hypothetical protein
MELFQDMIPEGCMGALGFRLAAYYTPEGQFAFQMSTEQGNSELPLAILLGMLEMVKHEFLQANDQANEMIWGIEDEDEQDDE